jgi:hypothetical protein
MTPYLALVLVTFVVFAATLFGVWVWTNRP